MPIVLATYLHPLQIMAKFQFDFDQSLAVKRVSNLHGLYAHDLRVTVVPLCLLGTTLAAVYRSRIFTPFS